MNYTNKYLRVQCFYVKNDITYEECQFDSHNVCIEIKWIRVTFVDCVYYIACCYYPPKPRRGIVLMSLSVNCAVT